jgi:hypothetical protein
LTSDPVCRAESPERYTPRDVIFIKLVWRCRFHLHAFPLFSSAWVAIWNRIPVNHIVLKVSSSGGTAQDSTTWVCCHASVCFRRPCPQYTRPGRLESDRSVLQLLRHMRHTCFFNHAEAELALNTTRGTSIASCMSGSLPSKTPDCSFESGCSFCQLPQI